VEANELPTVAGRCAADRKADEVHGEEAAAPDHVRRSEGERSRSERRNGREWADRGGETGEEPGRGDREGDSDDESETELADDEHDELLESVRIGTLDPRDQTERERDRHGVVASRLRLEGTGDAAPDVREAKRREHGSRVGGGDDGPEENRLEPCEVEEHACCDSCEERGHQHPDRAQERRRHCHASQPPPRGLQTSFEQDQDEADDADLTRELGVVELDPAGTVGAEEHPQGEEADENRHAGTCGTECEQDARTEHGPDDEESYAFVHADILAAPRRT
jgi:hypothetical protein